jgi:NAD(P)-dependent dehydrogenase (short-subunit alcohol dehydrogenase family)
MVQELKMQGKRALVTGSGTGIGREVALEFARQGADVVLHYSHSDAGAKSAVDEIQKMGRKAAAFQADFDKVSEVVSLGERALDLLGGVDCLINNAGITFNMPFEKVTEEQFDTMFHVNIRAQYFLTQKVIGQMVEQGKGAVCNMTSIHGLQGAVEHSVYAATKGAIMAYTRVLAVEYARKGVRVNAICPGGVTVENHFKFIEGLTEESNRESAKAVPAQRWGSPLDVAKLTVFLCSDDADYIVGQTVVIDGGATAMMGLMSGFADLPFTFGKGYVPGT